MKPDGESDDDDKEKNLLEAHGHDAGGSLT